MDRDYIKPTKQRPVFKCYNDYSGYIEDSFYKEWEIKTERCWTVGSTFALNLSEAIQDLHSYICKNKEYIALNSKFTIVMIDGKIDKYGEIKEIKCYSISMKQAKQFKII